MQRAEFLMHEPPGPPLNLTQTVVGDEDFLVFHGEKMVGLNGKSPWPGENRMVHEEGWWVSPSLFILK